MSEDNEVFEMNPPFNLNWQMYLALYNQVKIQYAEIVGFKAGLSQSEAKLKLAQNIIDDYVTHSEDCILRGWECGEPTLDGGYRTKYRGKWYQSKPIDETPKCDCGLDEGIDEIGKDNARD